MRLANNLITISLYGNEVDLLPFYGQDFASKPSNVTNCPSDGN